MSKSLVQGDNVPVDSQTTVQMLENDPAAVYQRLRSETPIVRIKAIGRIVFLRAEDVTRVKTDSEYFGSTDTTTPMQRAFGGHTLMRKDGCEHLRERQAMEASFAPALLCHHWKSKFEDLVNVQLQKLAGQSTIDLLPALAEPLSAGYVKLVLGIDNVIDTQLFDWALALTRGAMNGSFDPEPFRTSDRANVEMNACFDRMIERYTSEPDSSVLSVMVNQVEPIELSQMRTNLKICIGGAVIETRDAFLSTLYGLLSNPDQLRYCIEHDAWGRASEEGLRWIAPIQASPRVVKKALIMRGVCIPKGETVMAVQASANHDEDIWHQPEQFNVHRPPIAHQSFGDGAHKCLGGLVYRLLVSEIVLPKLFAQFPHLHLDKNFDIDIRGFAFRGPTSLPVSLN